MGQARGPSWPFGMPRERTCRNRVSLALFFPPSPGPKLFLIKKLSPDLGEQQLSADDSQITSLENCLVFF